MNTPLISIIVPIYNVEKYLDRCLDSIVMQTYQNLEIILVDDGSPDNCFEKCEQWAKKDNRIRVIHKENQGLGMARNTGIAHANGEYICYFDSDDYIALNTIALAYSKIQQTGADYVLFGHCIVFPDGSKSRFCAKVQKTVYSGKEITEELFPWLIQRDHSKEARCPFALSAWSGLLRRSILDDYHIQFQSERQIISEDTLYLLELFSKLSTVALIPEPLYFYCMNPTSLTKTYQKERQTKNNVFLQAAQEAVLKQAYNEEVWIRLTMLYQGFSLEAMKHIIRMPIPYREKQELLNPFFKDRTLSDAITWDTLTRSGCCMAAFLICFKWKLRVPCYLMLWLREKK